MSLTPGDASQLRVSREEDNMGHVILCFTLFMSLEVGSAACFRSVVSM